MNALLIITALLAGACTADVSHLLDPTLHKHPEVEIISATQDIEPDGRFAYAYEAANGIAAEAQGNPDGESRGSYRYIDSEGKPVSVVWTAGVDGFHAEGDSIPPTPESVVRTLKYIAANPYKEPETKP